MQINKFLQKALLAFDNSCINGKTYTEFTCDVERATAVLGESEIVFAKEKSKYEQAVKIVATILAQKTVVPLCDDYGEKRNQAIIGQFTDEKSLKGIATILFTSGTSGEPKGVMLSGNALANNIVAIKAYMGNTHRRILIFRPLVHSAVFTGELLYSLINGWDIEFWDKPFLPAEIASYIKEHNITIAGMTPTLLKAFQKFRVTLELKEVILSGERLFKEDALQFSKSMPSCKFYNVYGLTENSPRVCALKPEHFTQFAGSVGKPIRGINVKIRKGELLVKSKCLMKGYYKQKTLTRQKIKHGWLHTGDLAKQDKQGNIYLLGRNDDMIIRSGMNIYPMEIERVLLKCEGVDECLVYAQKDIKTGIKLAVDFSGECSEKMIAKFAGIHLPAYLIPNEFHKKARLEKTSSGKLKRRKI